MWCLGDAVEKVYRHLNSRILQVLSFARGPVPLSFMAHLNREENFALSLEEPGSHYPGGSEQTQESRLRAHGEDLVAIDSSPDDASNVTVCIATLLHRTESNRQ